MEKKELADLLYKALGRRIAELRRKAGPGFTQTRLADLSQLSRAAIANIERGRQRVALHHLYLIAQALGVEPAELLPLTGDEATAAQLPEDPKEREWLSRIARKTLGAKEEGDAETTTD